MSGALAEQHHLWNVQKVCTTTITTETAIYPKRPIAKSWFAKHPVHIWCQVTKIVLSKCVDVVFELNVPNSFHPISYYECSNYVPTLKQCSPGLYYNHLTLMCDVKSNVPCIMVPEYSSEEEDGENEGTFNWADASFLLKPFGVRFSLYSWHIVSTNWRSFLSTSKQLSILFLVR